ncbi:MAG: pirin family protein [Thermoplasmata archaeon]
MSETVRTVAHEFAGVDTLEGAGVKLRRMFGNADVPRLDPFLLLDNFRSTNPSDYVAGFPWHPHRGIETVTYMLDGRVEHADSLGNEGAIETGDVQWMSSGSGILHQEMPKRKEGLLEGFQLWVNMPAVQKMSTPTYRGLRAGEIPTVRRADGTVVKVVAGTFDGVEGPVRGLSVEPTYLDVTLPAAGSFDHPVPLGHTTFAYPLEGSGRIDDASRDAPLHLRRAALLGDGDRVKVRAGEDGLRFLLVAGRPIREPVAWYGPIVMNRPDELREAVAELRRGDFIKERKPIIEE